MSTERDYAREAEELRAKILNERYRTKSFSSLCGSSPEAQTKIMQFMSNKKNFLVYLGQPGTGKTHLCGAMFEWAIKFFSSFRYFKEKDLQEHLRKIMIERGWDTHAELERLLASDVIFLDDVGKIGHSEHKENMFFDLIDIRYNSMKPTVITSNLTRQEFSQIYEKRLCSRLFAAENIIIEAFDAPDYRKLGH